MPGALAHSCMGGGGRSPGEPWKNGMKARRKRQWKGGPFLPMHFMTWYILPSPFFSAMAFLPFCSSASLQAQTPLKAIEDGEPQEEDNGSLLPDDMKETWAECKQKLQKVTKNMADLSNEAQTILGHWLPSLTWQV